MHPHIWSISKPNSALTPHNLRWEASESGLATYQAHQVLPECSYRASWLSAYTLGREASSHKAFSADHQSYEGRQSSLCLYLARM